MEQDIGRIASRPRWRASPSTRFAVFAVPALIACAGCMEDPRGVCVRKSTGERLPATYISMFGGVMEWRVADSNGIVGRINATNSYQWQCRRLP